MSRPVTCVECGAPMKLRTGKYGKFYGCTRWPDCKGIHGAHQDSGLPLGKPANQQSRKARMAAHDAFDPLWKGPNPNMRRATAYKRLAVALGIDSKRCHIGEFDEATCLRVVELCKSGQLQHEEETG